MSEEYRIVKLKLDGQQSLSVPVDIKKNGRYIATMLARLEEILPHDSKEFQEARKIVLDGMNDFTRAILIEIFGNIEGLT